MCFGEIHVPFFFRPASKREFFHILFLFLYNCTWCICILTLLKDTFCNNSYISFMYMCTYIIKPPLKVTGRCVPDHCVPEHSVWDFLSMYFLSHVRCVREQCVPGWGLMLCRDRLGRDCRGHRDG